MRFAAIVLLLSLSACQPPVADQAQVEPTTTADPGVTPIADYEPASSPSPTARSKPMPEPAALEEPMEAVEAPQWLNAQEWEANAAKPKLCWHGYCPCEQPVNALDRTICRNARAGVEVSDDQWSIGAMARDLKRDGDESNRQMDEVMRDARSQRQQLWNSQRSGTAPAPDYPPEGADQDSGENFD